jgi:AcrR family transcriptional regulator
LTDLVGQYIFRVMPRRTPDSRFQELVEAASAVFIAQGYRRTQMADVATAMGVAKGTVYLYVESKEALFDVVLRYADAPRPLDPPDTMPVPTPPSGRTLRYVRDRLTEPASVTLRQRLGRSRFHIGADELTVIFSEIYGSMARNRTGIKLVDRCAIDYPELAKLWFTEGREVLLSELSRYLTVGMGRGRLRVVPDPAIAARLVLETLVFWAVHRHWDPSPQPVDPTVVQDAVIQLLVGALLERGKA